MTYQRDCKCNQIHYHHNIRLHHLYMEYYIADWHSNFGTLLGQLQMYLLLQNHHHNDNLHHSKIWKRVVCDRLECKIVGNEQTFDGI